MNAFPFDTCPFDSFSTGPVRLGAGSFGFFFRMICYPKPKFYVDRGSVRNMGRLQIGDRVSIFSRCIPDAQPTVPDTLGVYRIYGGSAGVRSRTLPVETTDEEEVGVFRGTFAPDNSDMPGRYNVLVTYMVNGIPRGEVLSFELLGGGHQLGAVVASISITRPDSGAVLTHTESGKVTMGRGAYLDEGV